MKLKMCVVFYQLFDARRVARGGGDVSQSSAMVSLGPWLLHLAAAYRRRRRTTLADLATH